MSRSGKVHTWKTLSFMDKLKICWGVMSMGDLAGFLPHEKNQYIFNKGYKTGIQDVRRPGAYKVVVTKRDGSSQDYSDFYDLQHATNFAKNKNKMPGQYAELFETFLDRDMDWLL